MNPIASSMSAKPRVTLAGSPPCHRLEWPSLLASLVLAASAVAHAGESIGIIHPVRDLALSVHVAAVVERVPVVVGQRLEAGQLILRQDSRMQDAERERRRVILEDRSELNSTEQRLRMIEGLVRDAQALYERAGTVSRDELTKLRLELESTRGRLEQLQQAKRREQVELRLADQELALRELRAPVPGIVTLIKAQAGEWSAPGDALVRLVDDSMCELRVNVGLEDARRLSTGAIVPVRVEDLAVRGPVNGRVTFVSPVSDAASSLVEVRVLIPNPERRIRPGVKGRLRLGPAS